MDAHITRLARPQARTRATAATPRATLEHLAPAHGRTQRPPPPGAPATESRSSRGESSFLRLYPNGDVLGASAGGGGDRVRILGAVHLATRGRTIQASARDAAREERRRRARRVQMGHRRVQVGHRRARPSAREGEEAPRGPPLARGDRARRRRPNLLAPADSGQEGRQIVRSDRAAHHRATRAHPVVQGKPLRPRHRRMRPRGPQRGGPRVLQGPPRRPHRPDPAQALAEQLRRVGGRV